MGQQGSDPGQVQTNLAGAWRRASAPLRLAPHALIVGAMKAGTTFLFSCLRQHPQFAPPVEKELHYFDNNFHQGPRWYRSRFPIRAWMSLRRGARVVSGEATPYYLFHPLAPERARAACPDARIIAILRDPVERAHSHYQQNVRLGYEKLAFDDALDAEADRLAGEEHRIRADGRYRSHAHQTYSYLARGLYAPQLARWLDHFGRDRLLVLESAALLNDPLASLARVFDFLALPAIEPRNLRPQNVGCYDDMSPRTRARLTRHFREPNERLFALLSQRFAWGCTPETRPPADARLTPAGPRVPAPPPLPSR